MKPWLGVAAVLGVVGSVEAVPCRLAWDYPVAEPVQAFALYKKPLGSTQFVLVKTVVPVGPRQVENGADTECVKGDTFVVTSKADGWVESDRSNELVINQTIAPGNLRVIFQITLQ